MLKSKEIFETTVVRWFDERKTWNRKTLFDAIWVVTAIVLRKN